LYLDDFVALRETDEGNGPRTTSNTAQDVRVIRGAIAQSSIDDYGEKSDNNDDSDDGNEEDTRVTYAPSPPIYTSSPTTSPGSGSSLPQNRSALYRGKRLAAHVHVPDPSIGTLSIADDNDLDPEKVLAPRPTLKQRQQEQQPGDNIVPHSIEHYEQARLEQTVSSPYNSTTIATWATTSIERAHGRDPGWATRPSMESAQSRGVTPPWGLSSSSSSLPDASAQLLPAGYGKFPKARMGALSISRAFDANDVNFSDLESRTGGRRDKVKGRANTPYPHVGASRGLKRTFTADDHDLEAEGSPSPQPALTQRQQEKQPFRGPLQ